VIALMGQRSGELLSYRGRVLLHDGPAAEVEYLLPSVRVTELPGPAERIAEHLGRPVMMLKDHPDLASVRRWPLDRGEFVVR
jgi:hypothetical protein